MTDTALGYSPAEPWKGHNRWTCDTCPFDSLDEQAIADHVTAAHIRARVSFRDTGLVDPDGQPIVVADPLEVLERIHTLSTGDLDGLTRDQLHELAERRDLDPKAKDTKPALVALLCPNDTPVDADPTAGDDTDPPAPDEETT